jgi:hypothetical protein
MLKKTSSLLMAVVCTFITFSQLSIVEFTSKNSNLYTSARHEGEKRGIPSTVYEFNPAMLERVGDKYIIRLESKTPFTCFGIGWKTTGMNRPAGDFKINFALEKQLKDKTFGESKSAEGDVHPTETETGMYWSELMFGYDEDARKYLYLELIVPNDVQIEKIRIDVMDLSGDVGTVFNKAPDENIQKSGACPPAPTIIQRAQWCGTYTACTNASYTPTVINPTHVVMHHGASPNTYTDGYAVVRSYWNYHVNTLAWSDIGYNYLIDKFGNVFLGRKNANYLTQDVRGSHAGNSNGASIGVNFLGNGDVTQPTPIQLEKLYDLLGWWFNSRNINITSAANITLQSGGTANLQRFVGHKDVNIGGTACPGTVIYDLLPSIRTQVVSLINGCTSAPTTASNLQRTVGACPQNNVSFSWSGSGSGWYIQISNSSSFSSPYIKYVSNLTSFTGPTGFVLQSNMTTPLTFSAGQTYYWRIFDNTSFVTGPSFTINPVPAQAAAISGTSAVCSGSSNTYSIAAVTGATSYTWSVPTGSTITAGQGTTSITVTAGVTAGNISVSASNACGTGTARTLAVTSNAVPAQAAAISGTSAVCSGSSNSYSIAAVTGATSYTWTAPVGSTITAGQGTTSITVTAGSTAGNIAVSASNACGTGTARTLAITSNAVPAQPTAITGTSAICNGSSNTYSIAAVTGATSYTWSVPAGSTITAGQGTTSITVTAGATAGNITVSASNACGTGTARTLAITSNTVPAQPTAITGTSAICNGSSNTYSIAAVTGATSYTWSVPTGSTITAGQGTTSITVTAGSTAGNITVSASNVCGTGTTRTLAVTSNALPAQPTAITGTSSVCAGSSSTYSIAAVTGATSYTWTVPAGSTITAGQGTTSITVTAGSTAGNIAVSAGNACGTGTARTLAVTLSTCADVTRPTTNVANPSWVTTDFTASFTDTENAGGSGLQYRFYQVIDKTGNEWRANKNDGFFNDNFEGTAINTDWNLVSGTWSVANGILSQNDQANANSNLYFAIPQVTSSQYLYNWKMKISGTGTNRRAGLHFFCDNATLSNRGNSYMVFFRADGNVAQVYEYLNNTMYLRASAACTVTPGVSYDYKVVLNPATGEINVYQNDVFIVSWTDTTPLTVGNHVSLRTADCAVEYDDIRILKSRTTAATVTAGNSTTKQIRYQNASSSSPSGKIVSIVTDVAKNISAESSSLVNLDFWGPFTVGTVNDGLAADIASQTSTTSLSANWTATSDANNTISHYSYAIGTSPGATNVVAWTNNGLNLSFTRTGLALTVGTTYYVSVRAHNIANLVSSVRTSNGVIISGAKMGEVSDLPENSFEDRDVIVYPNPVSDFLYLNRVDKDASLEIIDISGKVHEVEVLENEIPTLQVATLPSGTYFIRITQKGEVQVKKFVKK